MVKKLKNEKKALQMFCSNDEALHKKMTRPFINESYGDKAWAYYGDLLPDKVAEEPERISAYEFVGDSEKIYKWLFSDNLKLIGTANFKYGDEIIGQDNFIITIERNTDRYGKDCISLKYPRDYGRDLGGNMTIKGEPQEFVRRLVEERCIRVIPPTNIK